MLIELFTLTFTSDCSAELTLPTASEKKKKRKEIKSHSPGLTRAKEIQKTKISFYSVSSSFCRLCMCLCACTCVCARARKTLGRERKEVERRRLLFAARLLKRLYRAWQRGPACPSLIVLFILCAVQGVSNALGLCVGRETTHHILSSVPSWGGWGRWWWGVGAPYKRRRGTKSKL